MPWRSLVAAEAWDLASSALAALPETDARRPEVMLARARVAVGRCSCDEGAHALEAIATLRALDPPIAKEVRAVVDRLEVDALVCAQRWKEALEIKGPNALAARKGAVGARTLAKVKEGVGDLTGARAALVEAIKDAPHAGLSVGALLAWKLRLDRSLSDASGAEADRKRLFLEFPASFDAAVAAGESKAPPTSMSTEDWVARAKSLAALGDADGALLAIDEAAKLGLAPRRVAHEKGSMLYRARSYAKAATALDASAAMGNDASAIEDAFHAARARSRAGDDAAAISLYDALAKKHPSAHWGAEAGFLAGNLRFQHGEWKAAIEAFNIYLQKSSKVDGQQSNAREARRAKAIALLLDGNLTAVHALDVLGKSDDYEKDSYGAARIELLRAIAAQRFGESAEAIVRLQALRARFPYGWFDLVTRARLSKLGVVVEAWPTGPVPPLAPPSMPSAIDPLFVAGLSRDARDAWAKPSGDDVVLCATFEALDAGWDAYRLGQKFDTSKPPDITRDAWRCAFPTPFDDVVKALETREGLPRGTMHAVLRQESGFRIEVVSPAGAVGIAQLMPSTAATTAKECGMSIDPDDVAALEAPFLQLDLSARHLRALFEQFGGASSPRAAPLSIAAYNAGAAAVKRWLAEAGTLDADLFVERIPFVETRAYTARVTGNLVRYSILAGVQPPSLPPTFE